MKTELTSKQRRAIGFIESELGIIYKGNSVGEAGKFIGAFLKLAKESYWDNLVHEEAEEAFHQHDVW